MRVSKYAIAYVVMPKATMLEFKTSDISAMIAKRAIESPFITFNSDTNSNNALYNMNVQSFVNFLARGNKRANTYFANMIHDNASVYFNGFCIDDSDGTISSTIATDKLSTFNGRLSLLVHYSPTSKANINDIKTSINNGYSTTEDGIKYTVTARYERVNARTKKTTIKAYELTIDDGKDIVTTAIAVTNDSNAKSIRINNVGVWNFIKSTCAAWACELAHAYNRNNKTPNVCRIELVNIATGIAV